MNDFPKQFKEKIANDNTKIIVKLTTPNAYDEIHGFGHHKLTLNHPTDIVCRKSNYICSRTLMIKANKSSCDLNPNLIKDLKDESQLIFEIILD